MKTQTELEAETDNLGGSDGKMSWSFWQETAKQFFYTWLCSCLSIFWTILAICLIARVAGRDFPALDLGLAGWLITTAIFSAAAAMTTMASTVLSSTLAENKKFTKWTKKTAFEFTLIPTISEVIKIIRKIIRQER